MYCNTIYVCLELVQQPVNIYVLYFLQKNAEKNDITAIFTYSFILTVWGTSFCLCYQAAVNTSF